MLRLSATRRVESQHGRYFLSDGPLAVGNVDLAQPCSYTTFHNPQKAQTLRPEPQVGSMGSKNVELG